MLKRLVMLLALYAGSLGPSFALAAGDPPHDRQVAFDFACKVLEYDCSSVTPPAIVWTDLYHTWGALGVYNGDDSIMMDNSVMRFADPAYTNSILAHEIVHYLDVQLGVVELPFTHAAVCQSEYRAWRVGNAYVLVNGRADLVDYDWFQRYAGCFQ